VTVGFDLTPSGPLARLLVRALTGRPQERLPRRGPYVPPPDVVTRSTAWRPATGDLSVEDVLERCERLLRCTLVDDPFGEIADWLSPDLVVWTPVSCTRGLGEVLVVAHEIGTSSLTGVRIEILHADVAESRAYVEWRLFGRFTEPCFIDDDLLVEPTGRLVEIAGVLVVSFSVDGVVSVHCYYDDLAVLEQLVTAG
jgi:hypothetical protein